MPSDLSPDFPEKFSVVYRDRCCSDSSAPPGSGSPAYVKAVNLSDITLSDSTIDPKPTGVKDAVRTVHDSWVSAVPKTGDPANQSKLDDLATALAQDFYDWRSQSFDFGFDGIVSPPICALIDIAEWVLDSEAIDEDDEESYEDFEEDHVVRFHGPVTRFQTAPPGGEPDEFQHYDASSSPPTCGAQFIQIMGGPDATFGGYDWQGVSWHPALYLTNVGSGYKSTDSLTVSFSGTGSGSTDPTATIAPASTDPNKDGGVATPNIVTPGSKLVTLTATIEGGSGTGATLGTILDGGKLTGGGWIRTGVTGAVGANDSHGNPTPGDLAYESRGCLNVPPSGTGAQPWPQGAVYAAWRDTNTGRLLFFSSSIIPAQTVTISSYPTSAQVFYGCKALLYTGLNSSSQVPAEGDQPQYSTASNTFLAANLGSTVPTVGTNVKVEMTPTQNGPIFVFRYD